MKVDHLQLENIRCFSNAMVNLSSGINLIVGENNSGKSTLLRSLMVLQDASFGALPVRHGQSEGYVKIGLAEIDLDRFQPEQRTVVAGHNKLEVHQRFVAPSQSDGPVMYLHGSSYAFHRFKNKQPRNFIETYLSSRSHGNFSENINAQASASVGGDRNHLVAKIDACITSRHLRAPFLSACEAVLGFPISTWPTDGGKMAGLEVDPVRREFIPLHSLGSGVAQALGLIVSLLVTEGKVFLIEEPENDLHPAALRSLLSLIESSVLERRNQFFISTHSSVVVRQLGALRATTIVNVERDQKSQLSSFANTIPSTSDARRRILLSLGYEISDLELWSAWLLVEESSAERIIREFLIPMFSPKLIGRLRTVAALGVDDVEPRFIDLHRLFLFIHLEPVYRHRAWVIADGDPAGHKVVGGLREKFQDWDQQHFSCFSEAAFEHYYPKEFDVEVRQALAITDKSSRQTAKQMLCERLVEWLRADAARAKRALAESATDVIAKLQAIERSVVSSTP